MALESHAFKRRAWVVQTRGRCTGRIGQIEDGRETAKGIQYLVQIGASGPFVRLMHGSLRKALPEEIADMSGCRVCDLPMEERR